MERVPIQRDVKGLLGLPTWCAPAHRDPAESGFWRGRQHLAPRVLISICGAPLRCRTLVPSTCPLQLGTHLAALYAGCGRGRRACRVLLQDVESKLTKSLDDLIKARGAGGESSRRGGGGGRGGGRSARRGGGGAQASAPGAALTLAAPLVACAADSVWHKPRFTAPAMPCGQVFFGALVIVKLVLFNRNLTMQ